MSNVAIRVEDLSKQYRIGGLQERYKTLRDTLSDVFVAPFRRTVRLLRGQATGAADLDERIWVLQNISFEVKRGEIVGIIGRNGAGKSTLLKILSRITEPTEGSAFIQGRVGSLLEVGTGFHPELTGRDNIYLNGAILGMRRSEIDAKLDEIVSFAEVEKFVDTPVKHYSSGMYLRLAFAVAAHLEPDVFFVDEVLAVGDVQFQKKCLDKMRDVSQRGRTVLFVSHNMPAITRLCERTILLSEGRIIKDGPSHEVVSEYLKSGLGTTAAREWHDEKKVPGGDIVRLRAAQVETETGQLSETVDICRPVAIMMKYEVMKSGYILMPFYCLFNDEGIEVFGTVDQDLTWRGRVRPSGTYSSTVLIPGNLLAEGTIFVSVGLTTLHPTIPQFFERDALAFHVVDSLDGNSARADYGGHMTGVVRPLLEWRTVHIEKNEA